MFRLSLTGMVVAALLSSPLGADAQPITFNFTATVRGVPVLLQSGPIAVDQTVEGFFTFDPTVTDADERPFRGQYDNLIAFEISIPAAGYVASAVPGVLPGFVEIFNDEGTDPGPDGRRRDRYVASMTEPERIVSGPSVAGRPLRRLAIVMRDDGTVASPPDVFSSDALPLLPPSLADFNNDAAFILDFEMDGAGPGEVFATLTSLTISEVSVPDQFEAIAASIEELELGGTITGGQANSLQQKLEQALAQVADHHTGPAVNVLEAFQNQINAYVRSGRLTPEEGEALISAAQDIITALESTP